MGRSYDEQRMAELVYAEEYRRRLRRERAMAEVDSVAEDAAEARAMADSASAEVIEREREAAMARRARSEQILGRAPASHNNEWTPITARRDSADASSTEREDTGVDFEPITRATSTTDTTARETSTADGAGTVAGANTTVGAGTVAGADTTAGAGTVVGADTTVGAGTVAGANTTAGAGTIAGANTTAGAGTVASADAVFGSGSTTSVDATDGANARGSSTTTDTEALAESVTEAPTYRVVLDGDISAHRIEIGGMHFTSTGAHIVGGADATAATTRVGVEVDTGATRGGVAAASSRVVSDRDETDREAVRPRAASASVGAGAATAGAPRDVGASREATSAGTRAGAAASATRRGIIYADYGITPGGASAPFAAHTVRGADGAAIRMEAPQDTLGLADRPVGQTVGDIIENVDTPPSRGRAGGASVDGGGADTLDGDFDYPGRDTEEPEYEYDGGITRRRGGTDTPPTADEAEDFGRMLREEKRRRREGAAPTEGGARIDGIGTDVPYDGRVVEEPEGLLRGRTVDPRALEEEEYRRILGSEGGRVDMRGEPIAGTIVAGGGAQVPYDGRVVEDPDGLGATSAPDQSMLEEEDMLAFSRYYEERDAAGGAAPSASRIDYVGGYDMPPEERGADIPRVDTPYTAPRIEEGDAPTDFDADTRLDTAATRREMERDMTEFIRATERRDREIRERREGARRAPTTSEPGGTEGAPVYDKREITRRLSKYNSRDIELVETRIKTELSSLEARLEAMDMSFTEPDRAAKRTRKKLVRDIKKLTKRLTRAKKFEKKDNDRYAILAMTDIARARLPEAADAERLVEARERAFELLARRDELNARLCELYRGTTSKGASRGLAAREAAAKRGRLAEHKRLMRLERRMRVSKIAYDYRKRLEELMDAAVSLMGEIKLYEYILKREKPRGRAKREAKLGLRDAVRTYKKNKKEIARISEKAFRMAKDKKKRTGGAIAGWIALIFLAAVIGACVWQWSTIWDFLVEQVPLLGEIFEHVTANGGAVE